MAESEEDEQNKTGKLSDTVIYKIKQDQVEELKRKLLEASFRNVALNRDEIEREFGLTFYVLVRESKDKLVNLLKKHIHPNEINETYTRDNYILIVTVKNNQDAFAICSGKAYLHILPFADMDFPFNFAKAVLDPNNITQIKCRYLNGTTVRDDRYYHKSIPGLNRVLYLHNIFFIVDEFQSTIAPVNETNYRILKELTLKRKVKVKVKKSNLTFCKSLSLQEILDLMHDLSNLKHKDTMGFEFLDVARQIKEKELIKSLDTELENVLKENNELNENGFSLCPNDIEKWAKCEQVKLREKNTKMIQKSWICQPHISDVIVALDNQDPACFELNFKANGKWVKYETLINYVHGSIICQNKRYFHAGKNWYSVDENHIEEIEKSFNKLMQEKLMTKKNEMCLPLPWHSRCGNQHEGTIDAEHCITFCESVLKKTVGEEIISAIKSKIPGKCKSPPDDLIAIIGQSEYELYKQSLEQVDEGQYNQAYISLDRIWRKNTIKGPVPTFLVGDKILVQNVELFDILRNSDNTVYLYHVKEGFGQKTRDAASQIGISASLLYKSASHITNPDVLGEWYDRVIKYKENEQKDHLVETTENKEKFIKLFQSKKIVYVYAFLDNVKADRFQNVKSSGSQFEAACVTNSYIAMAELLWLEEEFKNYPGFKLQFCQIRKPWSSDDHSSSASFDPKGIKTKTTDTVTLSEILTRLESRVLEDGKNIVNVDRDNILAGGFSAFGSSSFQPWRRLDVKFSSEDAIDAGGPGREFMRLALRAIKELPIFIGPDNEKSIAFDHTCVTDDLYYKAGQMLAYFIVHRGPCPNFFSRTLYKALTEDFEPMQPTLEICNCELVEAIAAAVANEEDFTDAVLKAKKIIKLAKCDGLTEFNTENMTELVQSLRKFVVMETFGKFKKGLQTMELVDEIRNNKEQWKDVFIFSPKPLSASQIEKLFPVLWSENKSERKKKEKKTQKHWRMFLKDLEGGNVLKSDSKVCLSLENLLVFATGADQVPLLSFHGKPQLSFRHPEDIQEQSTVGFPFAITCTMELKIPVLNDYRKFKKNMAAAISMIPTFTNQ